MPDAASRQADHNALNELVVNCPDFERLEALLGGFNLFQVLKFEHGEIRHSNVLAWILDPGENHGLGDSFLKKWLMRTIHESSSEGGLPVSAVEIDGWRIQDVDVRREWKNIDVLAIVKVEGAGQWVICVENKVNSTQHTNQLARYRRIVEEEYPDATGRVFIFLTKDEEEAEDEVYIPASYTQVHRTLRECLESRSHSIGAEPRVLIENYLRLLEEKFMDQSEIARTALRIYQQHRRALDIIFEHKPDSIRQTTDALREKLAAAEKELGVTVLASRKFYVRLLPHSWDVDANRHGKAWSGVDSTVIIEVCVRANRAGVYAIAGHAPSPWIDNMWERSSKPPFERPKRAARPKKWCALHNFCDVQIKLGYDGGDDPVEAADRIVDKIRSTLAQDKSRQVIQAIASELPNLPG